MNIKQIRSGFVLLDVLGKARFKLEKHFKKHAPKMGPTPEEHRIPVIIVGHMIDVWGSDDGTSIEFSVEVDEVIHGQPGDRQGITRHANGNGVSVYTIRKGAPK